MVVEVSGCLWEWRSVVVDGSGGQWLSMGDGSGGQWLSMGVEVNGCQ